MYSVVLMAALTTGASAPDFNINFFCWGSLIDFGGYGGCGPWMGHPHPYSYGCPGCGNGFNTWAYYPGYPEPGFPPSHTPPRRQTTPPQGTTPEPIPKPRPEDWAARQNKARLIVELPADAKLFIDDERVRTTSARQAFNVPPLEPGQAYYYEVRVEIVRGGQTFRDTQQVVVRAGTEVRADFNGLERTAAAATRGTPAARR